MTKYEDYYEEDEKNYIKRRKNELIEERTEEIVKEKLIEEKYGKSYDDLSFNEQMEVMVDYSLDLDARLLAVTDPLAEMQAEMDVEMSSYDYNKGKRRTSYTPPSGGSACFIATAAYGTPFALEIDILRYWRDKSLKSNYIGNLFVRFYYLFSPPIADFIRKRDYLRKLVRKFLNPFVKYLSKKYGKSRGLT